MRASVGIDASGRVHGRQDGPPLTMVVLGDSTSTGPGLTDPEDTWFRQALAELDLPRPVEVVSLAVGGPLCLAAILLAGPLVDAWIGPGFDDARMVIAYLLSALLLGGTRIQKGASPPIAVERRRSQPISGGLE